MESNNPNINNAPKTSVGNDFSNIDRSNPDQPQYQRNFTWPPGSQNQQNSDAVMAANTFDSGTVMASRNEVNGDLSYNVPSGTLKGMPDFQNLYSHRDSSSEDDEDGGVAINIPKGPKAMREVARASTPPEERPSWVNPSYEEPALAMTPKKQSWVNPRYERQPDLATKVNDLKRQASGLRKEYVKKKPDLLKRKYPKVSDHPDRIKRREAYRAENGVPTSYKEYVKEATFVINRPPNPLKLTRHQRDSKKAAKKQKRDASHTLKRQNKRDLQNGLDDLLSGFSSLSSKPNKPLDLGTELEKMCLASNKPAGESFNDALTRTAGNQFDLPHQTTHAPTHESTGKNSVHARLGMLLQKMSDKPQQRPLQKSDRGNALKPVPKTPTPTKIEKPLQQTGRNTKKERDRSLKTPKPVLRKARTAKVEARAAMLATIHQHWPAGWMNLIDFNIRSTSDGKNVITEVSIEPSYLQHFVTLSALAPPQFVAKLLREECWKPRVSPKNQDFEGPKRMRQEQLRDVINRVQEGGVGAGQQSSGGVLGIGGTVADTAMDSGVNGTLMVT